MQLYLGVVPGIFPWLEESNIHRKMVEKKVGIMFSYWSFRKKSPEIVSKGFHDYFSFDGGIMVDSGAYSAFNSGVNIQVEDYSSFLSKIHLQNDDIVINLDVIGNSKKSEQNWNYLKKRFDLKMGPEGRLDDTEKDEEKSELSEELNLSYYL